MTKKMRFKPLDGDQYYNCPTGYYWVGHPRCDNKDKEERILIDNRDKLWFIDGVSDPDADYSYDEYALVQYKRIYYVCNTSGCSCPDPTETWSVIGFGTKQKALQEAIGNDYRTWVGEWALRNGWKPVDK